MSDATKSPPKSSIEPAAVTRPAGLAAVAAAVAAEAGGTTGGVTVGETGKRGPAPVHLWNPDYCGDIGLEIRTDGSWWYQGSVIGRPALVALFASVLRKDNDGRTYLVTPAEKILVTVADAPFLGVEMTTHGSGRDQTLTIRTNLDDEIAIGPDHPLRFETEADYGGLKPYVRVRGRLEARLSREVTRDLMALALEVPGGDLNPGVWSGGRWWPLEA